jgi:NAD(P)-dependent dehydrogenase (short-subunit alcohol dehydrogenase family)
MFRDNNRADFMTGTEATGSGGALRLDGRVALLVGGGQTPGQTTGNGRASAITYARAGARVLVADRSRDAAEETVREIIGEGGEAVAFEADVTKEQDIRAMIAAATSTWGQLDILHNNVGVSVAGGDAEISEIESNAFDSIMAINLRSMVLACKHALPVMREQQAGNIINISSTAAHETYPWVTYKASKAGMKAVTEQVALQNAPYGIRVNCIQPGLMNTPMAVDARMDAWNMSREEVVAMRDAKVPLGNRMGTAWDVANAALFLVSDQARFITGVTLMVDGGAHCRIG